jgi:hypothetical protein
MSWGWALRACVVWQVRYVGIGFVGGDASTGEASGREADNPFVKLSTPLLEPRMASATGMTRAGSGARKKERKIYLYELVLYFLNYQGGVRCALCRSALLPAISSPDASTHYAACPHSAICAQLTPARVRDPCAPHRSPRRQPGPGPVPRG